MLQSLHDKHPDATFILHLRNASRWSRFLDRWSSMNMRCQKMKGAVLQKWYDKQVARVRQFVSDHPSHANRIIPRMPW